MNSEIKTTLRFKKEAKRLSKKYPSLKNDLSDLETLLNRNPRSGTPPGNNFYKIRMQIGSKGKGKSADARVISHVDVTFLKDKMGHLDIYLATIYDKSEISTVTDKELKTLLKEIQQEFK